MPPDITFPQPPHRSHSIRVTVKFNYNPQVWQFQMAVDDGQAVLALKVGEELLLGEEAEADEVAREGAAVLALRLDGLDELLGAQVAAPL